MTFLRSLVRATTKCWPGVSQEISVDAHSQGHLWEPRLEALRMTPNWAPLQVPHGRSSSPHGWSSRTARLATIINKSNSCQEILGSQPQEKNLKKKKKKKEKNKQLKNERKKVYEVKEVNNRQDYCEKKQMQGQNNTKTNT